MRASLKVILLVLTLSWLVKGLAFPIFAPPLAYININSTPPPNITTLSALEETATTMFLFWTSGGGTTASFRIAYQSGSTAPSNCTSGTQVSAGTATRYTVTGLTANTTYSFRVCPASAGLAYASGLTVTIKTPASQPIFRSMGFNATTAKTTGASNAMAISGSIATFNTGLANNIGIGDVIQYSTTNGATMDRVAFIHGRLSSTEYLVKTASGGTPTAVSGNTTWSLFRAYINFANSASGAENTGIAAAVRNFDTWSGGANLVTLASTWHVVAYADATHNGNFTNLSTAWTTSTNNKLIFTTAYETRHVGTRQRHLGAWSTTYFNATVNDNSVFEADVGNVVFEGMQLQMTLSGVSDWIGPIMIGAAVVIPTNSVVEIKNNILEVVNNSSAARDVGAIHINLPNTGIKVYITNNIMICKPGASASPNRECMRGISSAYTSNETVSWTAYVYNNTIVGSWYYGMDFNKTSTGTETVFAKNNIVQGTLYEAYVVGAWGTGSGYNIQQNSVATLSGSGNKSNTTVSFVNAGTKDYHLAAGDTAAKNAGTDLSADANYPITIDIDTATRTGTWDIGADAD